MFISLMKLFSILYLWTWFVWPFIFVISIIYAIKALVKEEPVFMKPAIIASVALLIILAGISSPSLFS
ncbi:hypothetical protein SporoP37_03975 [Sporosarcina sp. P37]|uniref:hypothetical protein n=1 Tax=unclassified Sporosarcina TaxID=2647733 RepID=UPI0009C0C854|nr:MULTISPECIES: hypothetical protein [unclassified Sporosarcina]ARD47372.1 hypothetical protein SporoP33_03280 [Sporosarcina sp. P33]ARK23939.1 hypothetical protein SporoP37_03975 [Sporosarcina sp. P37]PID17691.1 hypothetical protein CSV62_11975 [Sporosarcina sp. P35]